MKNRRIALAALIICAAAPFIVINLFGARERRDEFEEEEGKRARAPISEFADDVFGGEQSARLPRAEYPLDTSEIRFTGMFGEPRRDHFHNGLDIAGNKVTIMPLYPGEIIFYFDEADDPTQTVYGPGNIVVMEHAGKIRTYYYHLYAGSAQKEFASLLDRDYLGLTGNSGRSSGAHLHLSIEDLERNTMIDPMTVLPAPTDDTRPPKVYGIYILTGNGLRNMNTGMTIRGKGPFKLYVKAYDMTGSITLGLKRVTFYVDGEVTRSYDFSKFIKKNFLYHLEPEFAYEDVYGVDPYFFRGGDFVPTARRHEFYAEVEDYGGNVASMKRVINFN